MNMNDPLRPLAHPVRSAGIGIAGILVVMIFGLVVARSLGWTELELPVLQGLSRAHSPVADAVALTINTLFSPPVAIVISVLAGAVTFIRTASLVRTGVFLFVVAGAWGSSDVVKYIVHRPRADVRALAHPLIFESSYSYPSGHTCFVAALAIAIVITCRANRWRSVAVAGGAVAVVAVAFSRVYLGVHYPADVTAAIVYSLSAAAVLAPLAFNVIVPVLRRRVPEAGARASLFWGTGYSVHTAVDERGRRVERDEAAPAADRRRH